MIVALNKNVSLVSEGLEVLNTETVKLYVKMFSLIEGRIPLIQPVAEFANSVLPCG
jgi:hypothetical protein